MYFHYCIHVHVHAFYKLLACYFSNKVSDVGLVKALHLSALSDIVHHWKNVATAEQLHKMVDQTLLQLKLHVHINKNRSCLSSNKKNSTIMHNIMSLNKLKKVQHTVHCT